MFDDLPRFMSNIAPRHAPSFGQEVCGRKAVQEVEGLGPVRGCVGERGASALQDQLEAEVLSGVLDLV